MALLDLDPKVVATARELAAVLAGDAVQDREDRVGRVVAQALDQARVDVALLDLDTHAAQGIGDASPGT